MTKPERLSAIHAKLKAGKSLNRADRKFLDEQDGGRWVSTLNQVALHFGIQRQSLDDWKPYDTEGALVKQGRGYDLGALQRLRDRMQAEGKSVNVIPGDITGKKESIGDVKLRKEQLSCDKLSTQIDILRGKYALIDDIMAQILPIIYAFKEKLTRLGPELAFEVSGATPADAEDRIRQATDKILTELCDDDLPRLEDALRKPNELGDDDGRMPAARETYGRQKA